MSWVCKFCGTNNDDGAETCLICDAKKEVMPAASSSRRASSSSPAPSSSSSSSASPAPSSSSSSNDSPAPSSSSLSSGSPTPSSSSSSGYVPSYSSYSDFSGIEMGELFSIGTIATIFFICLGLAVCATLLGGFLIGWGWSVMKWVLGAGWGLAIVSGLMALSSYLEEECSTETWSVPCAIFLGVFILLNFILYVLIGSGYKCIFIWFSAYSIIGAVLSALADFDDMEVGCGVFACFEGAFALIALILGLIFI